MSREELLEYLADLIDLEKDKYTQMSTIEQLDKQASLCEKEAQTIRRSIAATPSDYEYDRVQPDKSKWFLWPLLFVVVYAEFGSMLIWQLLGATGFIVVGVLGLIASIILAWCWELKRRVRNKADKIADLKRKSEVDKKLNGQRETRSKELAVAIPELRAHAKQIAEVSETTDMLLELYYMQDIIPPKYRNLVALCSFYDYISSGRTCSICINPATNDEGAVNIYERERVAYKMIEQLDAIGSNLGLLRAEQQMLRRTIEEGNAATQSMLRDISSDIKTGNDRLAMIQYQNAQQLKYQRYMADAVWHERMSH